MKAVAKTGVMDSSETLAEQEDSAYVDEVVLPFGIYIPSRTDENRQDVNRRLEIGQREEQKVPSLSENDHSVERRDSVKQESFWKNYVKPECRETFSKEELADGNEAECPVQQRRRDDIATKKVDSMNSSSVSGIKVCDTTEYLDSNDETCVEMPVSDREKTFNVASKKSIRRKAKEIKRFNTDVNRNDGEVESENSSDFQSIRIVSKCVDGNDDTFVDVLGGRTPGFGEGENDEISDDEWPMTSYTDEGRQMNTGRKREGITDLRLVLQEKKRKLEDSEKRVTPRNRRRVVEFIKRKPVAPEISIPTSSRTLYETSLKETTSDFEHNIGTPDRKNIAFEIKRRPASPDSEYRVSTPDHSEVITKTRRNMSSPDSDKRRKLISPELPSRARSPEWELKDSHRVYNNSRSGSSDGSRPGSVLDSRPGSSLGSRPGSGLGSRPGSSLSSRAGSSFGSRPESSLGSRPGSSSGLRPGSSLDLRARNDYCLDGPAGGSMSLRAENDATRFSPRKRSRKEYESPSRTRVQARFQSPRQSDDDRLHASSRYERQRSISPSDSHYSFISDKDYLTTTERISPGRESRRRSRFTVKTYDVRSSSSESNSYKTRRSDRNNNCSRRKETPAMRQQKNRQLDLSDDSFLLSK